MRILVTGSTGFIGSSLVPDLIKAGHQVLGLTRSEAGAEKLRVAGAEVLHGNLEDLDSLRKGVADSDGVIHLAFNHDFSQFEKNAADERKAIATLGTSLSQPRARANYCQMRLGFFHILSGQGQLHGSRY